MIPNIIHFVWPDRNYNGSSFHLIHRIAIESAFRVNNGNIIFHCGEEPEGEQWEIVRSFVTVNRRTVPESIFGNRLNHMAHRSDVMRLEAMIESGGIYLDIDTICVRPFVGLPDAACVLAHQASGRDGIGNSVMAAKPNSEFLKIWYRSYESFDRRRWSHHSVYVPSVLQRLFPSLVTMVDSALFYSITHGEIENLFSINFPSDTALVYHLWASHSWSPYLNRLTRDKILDHDTTYNVLARQYL